MYPNAYEVIVMYTKPCVDRLEYFIRYQ